MSVIFRDTEIIKLFCTDQPKEDVLYHHNELGEFQLGTYDEFQSQVLNFNQNGFKMIAVIPRSYQDYKLKLFLFQHNDVEKNSVCPIALSCARQFCGVSYLVKNHCWKCKMSGTDLMACGRCKVATYCSKECQKENYPLHKKFCKVVKSMDPRIADASENLEIEE